MSHGDSVPFQFRLNDLWDAAPDIEIVGVAVHGEDGRQCLQLRQNIETADVTRVQDVVHILERGKDFGTQ